MMPPLQLGELKDIMTIYAPYQQLEEWQIKAKALILVPPAMILKGYPWYRDILKLIELGDALAGPGNANVGKIKIKGWKGPGYILNPETDVAGVDWILAEEWWPYQRPSFVTPPFAGYVSGHSTYSRAAAEVMTFMTGDEYFPGGMGEFLCPKDEFLVFENGPSIDVTLQWATYRDASDECSLSRIWEEYTLP